MTVFPNPSKGTVNIRFNEPQTGNLSIYDLNGKLIHALSYTNQEQNWLLNTNLSTGIYHAEIVTPTSITNTKLVIE